MSHVDVTGKTLIDWGYAPGKWFRTGIETANQLRAKGSSDDEIKNYLNSLVPPPQPKLRDTPREYALFLDAETAQEQANLDGVRNSMDRLMRTPTVVHGAIMPDACPAGVIPVGGVVATERAIHPSFHSADVCCSMFMTVSDEPVSMDVAMAKTHFGWHKRYPDLPEPIEKMIGEFKRNPFLQGLESIAHAHFMTQGDGNHFLTVGTRESDGKHAIVTHHGSRGLGARVYRRGKAAAERNCPSIPSDLAWLDAESEEGVLYWLALKVIETWTRASHYFIHKTIRSDWDYQLFNPHNFVFYKHGLYWHAKGATPAYFGRTLVPMNMAEPILVIEQGSNPDAWGFAPHGAGRNMSRTQFLKENKPATPSNIDVRFYSGVPDPSEFPEAYKSAAVVQAQMHKYSLATVVDRIHPTGSIMAGHIEIPKR